MSLPKVPPPNGDPVWETDTIGSASYYTNYFQMCHHFLVAGKRTAYRDPSRGHNLSYQLNTAAFENSLYY